jgi:hypothetical protein
VHDHAGLGQCEREEHPHRIKGQQRSGLAAESDIDGGSGGRQQQDAVAEGEPVADVEK